MISRRNRAIVLLCFLISGATGLAYEVVWVRMLSLVFGATVLSVGSVLAAYMGGLALGSWFWSRRADVSTRPLRLYALLELGVASSALLTPVLFHAVQFVYSSLFVGGLSDFTALSIVRFLLVLPALVLPTFLMGGTLPVLSRFYTSSLSTIGRGVGDLYAVNTLGAVLGTLLTGFVAIPALGVRVTLLTAVTLNAAVVVIALALSSSAPLTAKKQSVDHRERSRQDNAVSIVIIGFALSGFAAMVYEVAWTRALVQVFGSSTYAFTSMLASFLIGLAAGAAVVGRVIDRFPHCFFAFAALEFLIGIWAVAATPFIEWLPSLFLRTYEHTRGSFALLQSFQFLICCVLILPTTMGLGAVLPVVSRIFSSRASGTGTSVGLPYAANTIGTVVGSVAAGFLLLPRIGIEMSIVAGALLNLLVATVVILIRRETVVRPALVFCAAVLGVIACGKLSLARLDPLVMTAGVYIYPDYFLDLDRQNLPMREAVRMKRILFHQEGYCSTVAVAAFQDGHLALLANGKTDASTRDLATQRSLAHLPMLLHPEAKDVLVVGLASGCTAGSILLHPVKRVDCVEIEPAMLKAARYFDPWNHRCLSDRRLHVVLQDARNYVMMSKQKYDMISAEPTNPWIAGVNALFTAEYYRLCYQRLRNNGLMCQWMPAYNFNARELRAALATFASVFPCVYVWSFPRMRSDFLVIGCKQPLHLDATRAFHSTPRRFPQDFEAAGTQDIWSMARGFVMDDAAVRRYCTDARLNTDNDPLLEFSTPKHLYKASDQEEMLREVYSTGKSSRIQLTLESGHKLLRTLGLRPASGSAIRVVGYFLRAYHPDDLNPGAARQDVAELQMQVTMPEGNALVRVVPWSQNAWPESLNSQWVSELAHPSGIAMTVNGARVFWVKSDQSLRASSRLSKTGVSVQWEVRGPTCSLAHLRNLIGATIN